ncbi:SprT-like domain-containing protein [Oerskovia enterophila]|uniref:SprT-like family protein n=1 Tax=Oerskovia enterophila TaxID=43678 RepID=A0ABX2Y4B9_9CELL|nr:SprT-like domain-containing protein [Oerskovia enterophila]OCI31394.1 SprT-like family protein [Oerskovia enterophila]
MAYEAERGTQGGAETYVEVRRSRRRKSTVSAYRDGERTIVSIPARFTRAQEREWVQRMLDRLADKERRRRPSDAELVARATELSAKYLDGRAHPTSVRWSSNQGRRWGSCTLIDGSIRISTRVQGMPEWVLDYVLLHELAHLLHAGHGPGFWALLESYPRTERAKGFLEGVSFTRDGGTPESPDEDKVAPPHVEIEAHPPLPQDDAAPEPAPRATPDRHAVPAGRGAQAPARESAR